MDVMPIEEWLSLAWYFALGLLMAYTIMQITDSAKRKRVLHLAIVLTLVKSSAILFLEP